MVPREDGTADRSRAGRGARQTLRRVRRRADTEDCKARREFCNQSQRKNDGRNSTESCGRCSCRPPERQKPCREKRYAFAVDFLTSCWITAGANWDADFRLMAESLPGYLAQGTPLAAGELQEVTPNCPRARTQQLRRDHPRPAWRKLTVKWILQNPQPFAFAGAKYKR